MYLRPLILTLNSYSLKASSKISQVPLLQPLVHYIKIYPTTF